MGLRRAIVAGAAVMFAMIGSARATPTFNLTFLGSTTSQAMAAFNLAAGYWSSVLYDNVTIDLTVGTGSLAGGILASTGAATTSYDYTTYRAAVANDVTSAQDAAALAHLPNTPGVSIYMNYTSDNPNGAGSATPYVDNNGDANNTTVWMTNANAKALGLVPVASQVSGCSSNCDGFIEFSNAYTYDYDPSDGITSGAFDFVGLAIHEIGHALGFISGVDILDTNATSPNFFAADAFKFVSPLDMYRCSAASVSAGTTLDFTAGTASKFFSLDDCATVLGQFSTGVVHGDGRQASHWKDNLGLGIMDPTANPGEQLIVTPLDLTGFDVIGWDTTPVPEPGVLLIGSAWMTGLLVARRRRSVSARQGQGPGLADPV